MQEHDPHTSATLPADRFPVLAVFWIFLQQGLTSFGGPVAHLGYFHQSFVVRRRWLDERAYAGLVALCQFLPGPASSQVGMAIGYHRAGYAGALAAWAGFTLPSALLMVAAAVLMVQRDVMNAGVIHGLKVAAAAIVAHAVMTMRATLAPDWPRLLIAGLAALPLLFMPWVFLQVVIIAVSFVAGFLLLPSPADAQMPQLRLVARGRAMLCAAVFLILLVAALASGTQVWGVFYTAGALVFGGGHVVLPLLQDAALVHGWLGIDAFMAGYGVAQALPGPLFAFAAYPGFSAAGAAGAVVATVAIFLPGFLVLFAALPYWQDIARHRKCAAGLAAVNAAVVGILFAALCHPVLTSAVMTWIDAVWIVTGLLLLQFRKIPVWAWVGGCAVIGFFVV